MPDITPLTLWTHHPMSKGGKMSGMWSWGNTNPFSNPFCMNKCTFGDHCYAKRYCKIRPKVRNAYEHNLELLKTHLKDEMLWAPLGSHRIQSFGEIFNETHWKNILRLSYNNKKSHFTIWTKQLDIIYNCKWKIPNNLQVIASGDYNSNDRKSELFPTFIVSKTKPDGKIIECKGKCILCRYCYGWSKYEKLNPEISIWERPK